MIRALIIDDEPSGVNTLRLFVQKYSSHIKIVGFTTEPEEGLEMIENYHPEVVFLDISMPDMNGFELLSRLKFKDFKLVFTTAHREYAIQAIKNGAFDYLLKPLDIDDFKQFEKKLAVEFAGSEVKIKAPEFLEIMARDGILYLRQKDIIRLEASGSYTNFYLENNIKHMASKAIKEYESGLDKNLFFRCHNSHIINLQKVEKFVNHEGFFARMNDGSMVDISRRNKDLFLEKIKNL